MAPNRFGEIALEGTVLSDDLDNKLVAFYKQASPMQSLVIDFEKADYIEIAALANCIAIIQQRHKQKQQTLLRYPRSKAVRDFLHLWRFIEAVESATGSSWTSFLMPGQGHYMQEPQNTYKNNGEGINALEYDSDWEQNTVGRRNFFEFLTFHENSRQTISQTSELAAAPSIVRDEWNRSLVKAVLRKHLPSSTPADDVARIVIFEAMTNAIKHPSATVIQVASRFEHNEAAIDKNRSHLRICIWDNGEGIASTLAKPLQENKPIRILHLPSYLSERVFVEERTFDKQSVQKYIVDQSEEVDQASLSEPRLLLMSMFAGISRNAADHQTSQDAGVQKKGLDLIQALSPGMGLYALSRVVLDQFLGSLVIRSGRYRMLYEPAYDSIRSVHKVRYRAKLTQYPPCCPIFSGNLIVIHIPLDSATNQ